MNKNQVFFIIIFLLNAGLGKTQIIRGNVIDKETGNPIQGVTVTAIGSGNSKQTNAEGRFAISVANRPDTLSFTHSGYNKYYQVITPGMDSITIRLDKNIEQLSEVLVQTGYQSIPKEQATGSYFYIDSTILNQQVPMKILDRLDGVTTSLLVDKRGADGPKYQIRGLSTLTDEIQSPLIILDNFPYEGDINSINPNDVESITILKDAAASSIWGARAGNGVIVISTKKAVKNQPLKITFHHSNSITGRPKILNTPTINATDQVELENFLYEKGYYDWRFSDTWQSPIPLVAEILHQQKTGVITSDEAQRQMDLLKSNDVRKDVYKYLYRGGRSNQTAISLSGAATKIRYLLSAGYDKDISALRGNSADRFTLRTDNSIDLSKYWVLQTGIIFTNSRNAENSPGSYGSYSFGTGGSMLPYDRLADDAGNPVPLNVFYRSIFTDTAGYGKLLDWKYSPLQQLAVNDNRNHLTDVLINLGSNYKVTKWLNLDIRYQYQQTQQQLARNNSLENYFTRDLVNMFTQINNGAVKYIVPKGGTFYTIENEKIAQSGRAQLNVNEAWKGIHEITAMAGAELRSAVSDYRAGTIYGINPNTLTTQPVDFTTQYPIYNGLRSNSFIPDGTNLNRFNNRFVSVYGNASYIYDKRYTLYASARRDASNLFGVRTNQKWVPLWSIGGLWKVHKEKFYNTRMLPVLSFRASYGMSGNLDPTTSALMRIGFVSSAGTVNQLPSVNITYPQNEDLRWERVKTLNMGVDFEIQNQILTGSIEYYRKHSVDLVSPVTTDPTLGYLNVRMNAASLKGDGWDIVLNSKNIDRTLAWNTALLFSYVNYKVENYGQPVSEEGLVTSGNLFPIAGYNPYTIIAYKWAGLDPQTGDPQGYLNGEVSKDYKAILTANFKNNIIYQSALPKYFGSIRNSFRYKKISLVFNITYKAGHHFVRPSVNYNRMYDYGTGSYEYANRWQTPGDEQFTNVPSRVYPANTQRDIFYNSSSIHVLNASHIRFRDAFAAYDFGGIHKVSMKGGQLYLSVSQTNWILWKAEKDGPDPELLYNPKPGAVISAGLKLNF